MLRDELEARRRELTLQLRRLDRQGFVPGKTLDLAAVEVTLRRQLEEIEDQLAAMEQNQDAE